MKGFLKKSGDVCRSGTFAAAWTLSQPYIQACTFLASQLSAQTVLVSCELGNRDPFLPCLAIEMVQPMVTKCGLITIGFRTFLSSGAGGRAAKSQHSQFGISFFRSTILDPRTSHLSSGRIEQWRMQITFWNQRRQKNVNDLSGSISSDEQRF